MIAALPGAARNWALFLDVDGTLIDFADHPDAVSVRGGLIDELTELSALSGGALALVSGRSIAVLDGLFAPLSLPAAGLHGLERRGPDGCYESGADFALIEPFRAPMTAIAASLPGAFVEDKGAALAVHVRLCLDPIAAADQVLKAALGIRAGDRRIKMLSGKSVVEVKPAAADKGDAVRWFMQRPPFAGRVPVFVGDDVTDEDGFAAVNALNGMSVKVGAGESAALQRLADTVETAQWLRLNARLWREGAAAQ